MNTPVKEFSAIFPSSYLKVGKVVRGGHRSDVVVTYPLGFTYLSLPPPGRVPGDTGTTLFRPTGIRGVAPL